MHPRMQIRRRNANERAPVLLIGWWVSVLHTVQTAVTVLKSCVRVYVSSHFLCWLLSHPVFGQRIPVFGEREERRQRWRRETRERAEEGGEKEKWREERRRGEEREVERWEARRGENREKVRQSEEEREQERGEQTWRHHDRNALREGIGNRNTKHSSGRQPFFLSGSIDSCYYGMANIQLQKLRRFGLNLGTKEINTIVFTEAAYIQAFQ